MKIFDLDEPFIFNGKHARICYRPLTDHTVPVFLVKTKSTINGTKVPIMPFLHHCADCVKLIVVEKKQVVNGAN
jgi:hypothetical protein